MVRFRVAVVAALLVTAGLGAVAAPTVAAVPDGVAQTDQTIVVTQEFRLTPDRPGYIEVRWSFDVPPAVSALRVQVPTGAEGVRPEGFTSVTGGQYEWDGETETPTLTFSVPVNETRQVRGPEGDEGQYVFVDTGDWAIAPVDVVGPGYTYRSTVDVSVRQRNVTAGPGVAGSSMVFLGSHEEYVRSAHGQQFRLVVPEAADLAPSRSAVFDSVTAASDTLRVGDRDEQVLMIAAPTGVAWGVEGLQRGDRDFYVTADEGVNVADNVWLHEYVHTRQSFNLTADTRWLVEGTAQYYAARLTLEQNRIDFRAFADALRRGTYDRFSDAVLAEPSTWSAANYYVGALVTGDLDRRIRLATDSSNTFQAVFRRLNDRSEATSQRAFLRIVRETSTEGVADRARLYTGTTERPSVWSAEQHEAAFGPLPALVEYAVASVAVRGPYRNESLPSAGQFGLVAGETVRVTATATNVGGRPGTYNLTLARGGRVVDYAAGRLAPDETVTLPVAATFEDPGTYTLSVAESRRTVTVRPPATLAVSALSVDRRRPDPGETVTVSVTLRNDAERPGRLRLDVARDGTTVDGRTVYLRAGGERTVTVPVEVPTAGRHTITAGGRSVVVFAGDVGPTPGGRTADGSTPGGATPGSGPAVALVVLALLALRARREG